MSKADSRREALAEMITIAEDSGLYETIDVGEVNWNATAVQYMELNKQKTEAIQRVRDVHKPVEYHGQFYCSVCSYDGIPESLAYPCPTIKALDCDTDV